MTAFLICAGVGLIFLLISLFSGGDHDVGTHVDTHFDHSLDHHAEAGEHEHSMNVLSVRSIMAFLAAFGAVGALCLHNGMSNGWSIGLGVLAGVLMALLAAKLMQLAMKQQVDSTQSISHFVGVVGIVTTPIPASGLGEVEVSSAGQRRYLTASSRSGDAIGMNKHVKVVSAAGSNLVVELQT